MEGTSNFIKSQLDLFGIKRNRAILETRLKICIMFTDRVRAFNLVGGAQWNKIAHHKDAAGASITMTQVAIIPKGVWKKVEVEKQKWFLNDFLKATLKGKRVEPGVAQKILFDPNKAHDFFSCA